MGAMMVQFSVWCDRCKRMRYTDSKSTEYLICEPNTIDCNCGNTLIWANSEFVENK